MIIALGLPAASRAEDPESFLDLRIAVSPYSRIDLDELQQLHASLSFGFLRWGFVVVDVDHGAYNEYDHHGTGQTLRVMAGLRLRGPDLLDAAGNGLLMESALALGYERTAWGENGPDFRLSISALYWFWRGRLAAGVELGNDVGYTSGVHAALVAAVAFPWSGAGAKPAVPAAQTEPGVPPGESLDIRLRVSPPFCSGNLPVGIFAMRLNITLTILEHLVLEYDPNWAGHFSGATTLSHTFMLGGRIRALDLRDEAGSGLTLDTAILVGYSTYDDEVFEDRLITMEAVALRQDWDLIYWFIQKFGVGLSFSLGYTLPLRVSHGTADQNDLDAALKPHGGLGAAVVFSSAF